MFFCRCRRRSSWRSPCQIAASWKSIPSAIAAAISGLVAAQRSWPYEMELDPQSVFGGFGAAEQNEPVADLVPPAITDARPEGPSVSPAAIPCEAAIWLRLPRGRQSGSDLSHFIAVIERSACCRPSSEED